MTADREYWTLILVSYAIRKVLQFDMHSDKYTTSTIKIKVKKIIIRIVIDSDCIFSQEIFKPDKNYEI